MIWHLAKRILVACLLTTALSAILFSEYFQSTASLEWLQTIAREVAAACRDSQTQWMVVLCLAIYFVLFLFLERRGVLSAISFGNTTTTIG